MRTLKPTGTVTLLWLALTVLMVSLVLPFVTLSNTAYERNLTIKTFQALNCDGQAQNTQQLTYAFTAAANSKTPFVLFISPDFVHFSYTDPGPIITFLKPWLSQPAYFKYEGKPFVSSFWGQGLDWNAVRAEVGSLYVVPYYVASSAAANDAAVDGLFSW